MLKLGREKPKCTARAKNIKINTNKNKQLHACDGNELTL